MIYKKVLFIIVNSKLTLPILMLFTVIGFGLITIGLLTPPPPTQVVVTIIVTTTPNEAISLITSTATSTPSITTESITTTSLPETLSPTPTICGLAPGWVSYVVQPGDTLTALAQATTTTVPQIILVNCLPNDIIYRDQVLLLPFIPIPKMPTTPIPPPTTLVPVVTPTLPPSPTLSPSATFAPSSTVTLTSTPTPECFFNCETLDSAPEIILAPGGGNEDNPCNPAKEEPWIDININVPVDPLATPTIELGQQIYFSLCDFPAPSSFEVEIISPIGTIPLTVTTASPYPGFNMGRAQSLATWSVFCYLPTGAYTLLVLDAEANPVEWKFEVKESHVHRILTDKVISPPGTLLQVYLCGYNDVANQVISIEIYYQVDFSEGSYSFTSGSSFNVSISNMGWATATIQSLTTDPPRSYLLKDGVAGNGEYQIWLLP